MPLSSMGIDLHTALSHHEDNHHDHNHNNHHKDHHEKDEIAHVIERILIGFAFHAQDDHSNNHQHFKVNQLTFNRDSKLDLNLEKEEMLSFVKTVALSSHVNYQLLKNNYYHEIWPSLYEKTYKPSPHQYRNRPLLN